MSYSPTLGRFLETDPEGYVDGPNTYQFVASNPEKYLDPAGTALIIGGVGGIGAYSPGIGGHVTGDAVIGIGSDDHGIHIGGAVSGGIGPIFGPVVGAGVGPEVGYYPGIGDIRDIGGGGVSVIGVYGPVDVTWDPPVRGFQPGGVVVGLPIGPGDIVGGGVGVQGSATAAGGIIDLPTGGPDGVIDPLTPVTDIRIPIAGLTGKTPCDPGSPFPSDPGTHIPMDPGQQLPHDPGIQIPNLPTIRLPGSSIIDGVRSVIDGIRGILRPRF